MLNICGLCLSAGFPECQGLLCSAVQLATPGVEKPFKLQVNTSHMGAGAVLMQSDNQGVGRSLTTL